MVGIFLHFALPLEASYSLGHILVTFQRPKSAANSESISIP